MKRILIFACVTLGILAIELLPHASHTESVYPENLWTKGGQFGEPSTTRSMLHWNRTEYGLPWAWLVRDTCTTEPAWYARIEPRYLMLYSAVALFGGGASIVFIGLKKRNPVRETTLVLRNAAVVTVAVILGFCVGSALGLPVWLQGFFLIPGMLLFYMLAGERCPPLWKVFGFIGLLSIFVLLVSLGFKHVPEEYFWIYFILIALVPLGPILDWFERRLTPKNDKSEQDIPPNT